MKWASLMGLGAVLFSVGCAGATSTAGPAESPEEQPVSEELAVVQTPQSGMLPGSSEWDWTPLEQEANTGTDAQIPATSLQRNDTTSSKKLKKRLSPRLQ